MMTSYFNLLKYAATGIASPDMTYYDRMRASTLMGGVVKTLTGQPPLTFKSDGSPITVWSMKGNGSQSGTPTPDNPVMPEFVGVKTGNLFDKSSATIYKAYINDQGYWLPSDDSRSVKIPCVPNTRYTLSIPQSIAVFRIYETSDSSALPSDQTVLNRLVRSQDRSQSTFTTGANAAAIIFQGSSSAVDTWFNGLMLNTGSTALPYEQFGYKIPLTCAETTVTVYTGDPLRKALDGSDAVDVLSSTGTITRAVDAEGNALATPTTQIVDVPEIPTTKGQNTLTVDTPIQPSEMTITFKG